MVGCALMHVEDLEHRVKVRWRRPLQACKGEECAQVQYRERECPQMFGEKSQPDVCGVWQVKRRSPEWCQGSHFPRKEHGSR